MRCGPRWRRSLQGRRPLRLAGSRADSNPLYGVFGPFDILYLFKVIASLFALLFMYDAVSGEKESGALRLVFANAVPRRSVLAGKILGRLACALVPLVTPLLIGLLVLQAVSPAPFTADEWREIAVLAGVLVSYVVVFAMLGIAISTLTTRAFESLVASVAVWLLFLIVIPQSAGMAATAVYPAGSRAEAEERKLVAMNLRLGEARDEQTRYLRDHPLAGTTPDDYRRWMDAMREWARDLQQRVLSDVAAVEARIAEEQEAQQSRQARAAHAIARLSPAWLLTEAVTTLTGTNYEERVRFLASVRTYNWDFAAYVTDKRFASNDAMNLLSTETRLALDDFPQFEYRPGRPSVGTVAMDVLGLACFGIAFFAVAHAAFVRYDVR